MSDLEKKIEFYKKEAERLENYLVECLQIFIDSDISMPESGICKTTPTLKDYIRVAVVKDEVRACDAENFARGAKAAYHDCIDLLQDIADDTEEFIPNNERALKLATAYRQLGDGIQERLSMVCNLDHEGLKEAKRRGRFG